MPTACYVRVSTEDQNLERQLNSTKGYAEKELDRQLSDLKIFRDKSTGTDTARGDYRDLMEAVEYGEVDEVVVKSVSRIARSIRDLDRTAERIKDAGAELHIIDEGLVLKPEENDPYQNALFRVLGVFAELEAEIAQKRTKEGIAARQEHNEYHHGPAPLGFEKDDGRLVEAEDYDLVCAVLEMKASGEMGTREAARELGCGTATINRCLEERASLYGL
jgi:DNA invertase Pin-like site-specific DNA recombinase